MGVPLARSPWRGQLRSQVVPGVIFNTQVSANELLRLILSQFELNPVADKAQNLET